VEPFYSIAGGRVADVAVVRISQHGGDGIGNYYENGKE
jgi:hypothetical protein